MAVEVRRHPLSEGTSHSETRLAIQAVEAELQEALAAERKRTRRAQKKIYDLKRKYLGELATEQEKRMELECMLACSSSKVALFAPC